MPRQSCSYCRIGPGIPRLQVIYNVELRSIRPCKESRRWRQGIRMPSWSQRMRRQSRPIMHLGSFEGQTRCSRTIRCLPNEKGFGRFWTWSKLDNVKVTKELMSVSHRMFIVHSAPNKPVPSGLMWKHALTVNWAVNYNWPPKLRRKPFAIHWRTFQLFYSTA